MSIFYIPNNSTQYMNWTSTLLTSNKQQIRNLFEAKYAVDGLLMVRIGP